MRRHLANGGSFGAFSLNILKKIDAAAIFKSGDYEEQDFFNRPRVVQTMIHLHQCKRQFHSRPSIILQQINGGETQESKEDNLSSTVKLLSKD